jgi:hypothetical protein
MDKRNKIFDDISKIIDTFNDSFAKQMPNIEREVDQLIENKNEDKQIIERYLDTLLSLTIHGLADKLFVKLLDYYKTIDAEGAEFYWNEYDKKEE